MASDKDLYLKKVSELIKKRHSEFAVLETKEELSDSEVELLSKITEDILSIKEQPKTIKSLQSNDIVKLNNLSNSLLQYSKIFSYDVKNDKYLQNITSLTYNDNVGSNLIINNFYNGNGLNRKTLGIIDDVTNYTNDPILNISKQTGNKSYGGYIHQVGVKEEYKVSFEFILSRFPSKTYQDSDKNYSMRKITTRRTDLISFFYKDFENKQENVNPNVIEFGAMAPMGIFFDSKQMSSVENLVESFKLKTPEPTEGEEPTPKGEKSNHYSYVEDVVKKLNNPPYKNEYSQFSIAASITCGNNYRISVSTDYKFQLGNTYVVTLIVRKNDDFEFGKEGDYEIILEVDGVKELVFPYIGKVWGKSGNVGKNRNLIPSQPNFRYRYLPKNLNINDEKETKIVTESINKTYSRIPDEKTIFNLKRLNLSTLEKIKTVPYVHTYKGINNIYNKKVYKTNRGVIFKTIDIYMK